MASFLLILILKDKSNQIPVLKAPQATVKMIRAISITHATIKVRDLHSQMRHFQLRIHLRKITRNYVIFL